MAHVYLSGSEEPIQLGNFIADFVKGKAWEFYPAEVRKGISLHRQIDNYTDMHPLVRQGRARLWERHRHYGGVILDIFYDHFLASTWSFYTQEPLRAYTERFYQVVRKHYELIPTPLRDVFPYIEKENWLYHYQYKSGIEKALQGMARRAKFPSNMGTAIPDLEKDYNIFKMEFHSFFDDLRNFSVRTLRDLH